MKKIICVLAAALFLASPAFSQIRIGGWGRTVWVPLLIDQEGEPRSVVHAPWGEEPGLEFMLTGATANIGVDVGILVEKGAAERGSFSQIANAKVWWSPNRYFKLHIGAGRVSEMRGKAYSSNGLYAYARGLHTGISSRGGDNEPYVKIDDGDGIFNRFNLSRVGAIMELTPIPDLYVGAAVMPEYKDNRGNYAEDVYKNLHAVAGYDIRGIGLFRVGYVGGGSGSDGLIANTARNSDFSLDRRIEAAFSVLPIPNIFMDIGMKYSLEKRPGTLIERTGFSLENPLYIAMGLVFTGVPNLRLGFAMDGHFAGSADISAPQIAFNIFPSYNIGYCDIGADFTFGGQFGDLEGVNDKQILGFGVYADKSYGGGSFRAGIYANAPMNEGQKWGMVIPVWITYSF